MAEGKRMGRPPKTPEKGKRQNYTFRMSAADRLRLEASAEAGGRSLSEEIERRISQSLLMDDMTTAIREQIRQEMRAEFEARPESGFVRKSATEYRIVSRKQFAALNKGAA